MTSHFIAFMLRAKVIDSFRIFEAFFCKSRIRIFPDIGSTGKCRSHFTADSRVIAVRSQPISRSVIMLRFRRSHHAVVNTAISNNMTDSSHFAGVVQECCFHHVFCISFQDSHHMFLTTSLCINAGVKIFGHCQRRHAEAHCQIKFNMVTGIMIAAADINFTVTIRVNQRLTGRIKISCIGEQCIFVFYMAISTPCEGIAVNITAAGICIKKIQ